MTKDGIRHILFDHLAPVFKARVELVEKLNRDFYLGPNGEAELLNMALISSYLKTLSPEHDLKRIHDKEFFSYTYCTNTRKLIGISKDDIRNADWHTDFRAQKFSDLVHLWAQDAGVDDFYNAIEKCPKEKAPIDRFGNILSWDEMRHSQILSAPIHDYFPDQEFRPVQNVKSSDIDSFCLQKTSGKQKISVSYNQNTTILLNNALRTH